MPDRIPHLLHVVGIAELYHRTATPRVDVHIPLNPADGPRHRGYSDLRLPPSRELRRDTQREIDLAAISLTQYFGHDERRFRQTFLLT